MPPPIETEVHSCAGPKSRPWASDTRDTEKPRSQVDDGDEILPRTRLQRARESSRSIAQVAVALHHRELMPSARTGLDGSRVGDSSGHLVAKRAVDAALSMSAAGDHVSRRWR